MATSVEKRTPVSKNPNWYLFCTGGLLTVGGLGWNLRLAYAEQPKAALVSSLAGTAGICLMNTVFLKISGKEDSKMTTSEWFIVITGGILTASGFGYYLNFTLREHPISGIMAYAVGSLGYAMASAVLYSVCGNDKKKTSRKYSNKEVADMVRSANAGLHFMGSTKQCEFCKAYVDNVLRELREAEKSKERDVKVGGILQYIREILLFLVRANNQDSLSAKKTSSRGSLKREISKTCRDNVKKEQSSGRESKKCSGKRKDTNSNKKQFSGNDRNEAFSGRSVEIVRICAPDPKTSIIANTAPRPVMNLSRDTGPVPRYVDILTGYRMPMTVPNTFPDEKSTQTESQRRIMSTQTEASYLVSVNKTAGEDPTTTDSPSASAPSTSEGAHPPTS